MNLNTNQFSKKMSAKIPFIAAGVVLGAAGFWAARTIWKNYSFDKKVSPEIRSKLPIAQNLETIEDHVAHYDMDGVSFDDDGVIVSGDQVKPITAPI